MKPILDRCGVCAVRCSKCKVCVDGDMYKPIGPDACRVVKVPYFDNCLDIVPRSAVKR